MFALTHEGRPEAAFGQGIARPVEAHEPEDALAMAATKSAENQAPHASAAVGAASYERPFALSMKG